MKRFFFIILGFFLFSCFLYFVVIFFFSHHSLEFNIKNGTTSVIDSVYVANLEWDTVWTKNIPPFRCRSLDLVFKKKEGDPQHQV